MVKEIKELIQIVGKGNLLEALFIFLGNYQHADLNRDKDHRNHSGIFQFINKEEEPLDKYFNLRFSLQGLFFIYFQAYRILKENSRLNTQEVIDRVYKAVNDLLKYEQWPLTNTQKKLELFNYLGNPKGKPIFITEKDFEDKVLVGVRELLSKETGSLYDWFKILLARFRLNKHDREFAVNTLVIERFYQIHRDIKVDKYVALLFSIGTHYKKLSPFNQSIGQEKLAIIDNPVILFYIANLARALSTSIDLLDQNEAVRYSLNQQGVNSFNISSNMLANGNSHGILCLKSVGPTFKQLLKEQDGRQFEKRVIKNTYYSPPQEKNGCMPCNNRKLKEDHKNTICKLIVGVFILSVILCAFDYLFMGQKLLNPMKNVLPQDSLTNMIIAVAFTTIIVYALFELFKSPKDSPNSAINEVNSNSFLNGPAHIRSH
ncbi:WD1261 family protein [Wolbachia endosymbiont of Ctenocephalides felis wCfeT]|uniref:WD1261 family protein n=1 Tax=Wolbachia endosymbiont of Ctenocephalides felis wCfeT TaxID=2732593 RepID=UPI001445DB93|nr:hypothetical protein [Wolbachia endosymbiont of Ctenocephalides felis wCfeT]